MEECRPDEQLPGHEQMLAHLQQTLKQMEDAHGEDDEEARSALALLRQKTAELAAAQAAAPRPDAQPGAQQDIRIAASLDRLQEQLEDFEDRVAGTDAHTQKLLGDSTALWMAKPTEQKKPA